MTNDTHETLLTKHFLSPIVLFVYSRPAHTKKTIESLKKNKLSLDSDLFIFSDGPKTSSDAKAVEAVRKYIKTIVGFRHIQIIEAPKNKGLADSIISGVTQIINRYNRVIVLEDDLETSKNFLKYMNNALSFYQDTTNIWSISGFCPPIKIPDGYKKPIYLSYRSSSYGWATWKDRWDKNDWQIKDYEQFRKDKKKKEKFNRGGKDLTSLLEYQMKGDIDSWAVRWCYNQFKLDMFSIYPVISKIRNIGFDGSGTHSNLSQKNETNLDSGINKIFFESIVPDKEILNLFAAHYDPRIKGKIVKLLRILGIYQSTKKLLKRLGLL